MLGTIVLFAGNFAPKGWAFCNGQLLPILSNPALYSILGVKYGGDGISTFALPDFQGRVPIGTGNNAHPLGQKSGTESVTIQPINMPEFVNSGTTDIPTSGSVVQAATIGTVNIAAAHNNMQPYLGLNYIIALVGVYPSQG